MRTVEDSIPGSSSLEASAPTSGAFEMQLAWSDRILVVNPDQTALAILLAEGFPVEPGCGAGGCGMCMTAYVDGDIVHKDACLSPSERARSSRRRTERTAGNRS
jgi:vanillate O-demethylase ferredoxin subunit